MTIFFLQYGWEKLQVCEVLDLSMSDFKHNEYLSGAYLGAKNIYTFLQKQFAALTLFRMGLFGGAHGWGDKKPPLLKICHKYHTKIKLNTVIPYLKMTPKIYESHDTPLDFC